MSGGLVFSSVDEMIRISIDHEGMFIMRIAKVNRLHDCGVFRRFDWPANLHPFGQYNLIYGWNGTGKSTLTRILYCLETKTAPQGTVTLVVDGNELHGHSFATAGLSIRVFDRDFVERTVRASTQSETGGSDVPPIVVIGEKNVENQRKADLARKQLAEMQSQLLNNRTNSQHAQDTMDAFCTDQAKLIKDLLTQTGSVYNNYNRSNFKAKADLLAAKADVTPDILDEEARASRIQKHQSTQRQKLPTVDYDVPDLKAAYFDLAALCARIVTSDAIESLKADPDAADWVKAGREKHAARNTVTCIFCGQPIPAARLQSINNHFNDAYQNLIDEIAKRRRKIESLEESCKSIQVPKKTEVYEHLASKLEAAVLPFESLLRQVMTAFSVLRDVLETKHDAPFAAIEFKSPPPDIDSALVEAVNQVIVEHNTHSDEFATAIKKAREEIEVSNVAFVAEKYKELRATIKLAAAKIQTTQSDIRALEAQIAALEKELRDDRTPAEELNLDLQHYLGHADLKLEVLDTGYRITRGGQTATRLSEGEQTAISLLYFLKSLSSKDFKLDAGIVVLDDPVCSLDANALFSAFGYIKERTKAAKQLFVLTHNFMLFRQVKRWFHKLPNQNKKNIELRPARFYMLQCSVVDGQRRSEMCWLDQLLEHYESDYHYTFFLIHELANEPTKPLESYFVAPNLARKLMETFLAFHSPGPGGESNFAKLDDINFDERKKARVLRFLNEHSHSGAVGGDQQDFSGLNETPSVLKDLLGMIESANKAHYDGMVAIVAPTTR